MAVLFPYIQFLDASGDPLNAGTINTYITGTSTNKTTYQDQAEGTSNANPIVLDSEGRPPGGAIWLDTDAEYRFLIKDSAGNTIDTLDDISGIPSAANNIDIPDGKGFIDANGNEALILGTTASAVNYVKVSNSATTAGPTIESLGDDTNVDLNINTKGSGSVLVNGITISGALFQDYISGLNLTNDSGDTSHDIEIGTGTAADATNATTMTLSSVLTKKIDAGWAAGDDAGGLPSAVSLTNATWYHVFVIKHTDGTVDGGFDTSLTASNLLTDSSYTYYRRVGSVYTDGSANIVQFIQTGDTIRWAVPDNDVSTANPGTSAVTSTLTVPPDVIVEADLAVNVEDASTGTSVNGLLTSPNQTDTAPTATLSNFGTSLGTATSVKQRTNIRCLTNTSKQIRYRLDTSNADITVNITVHGWKDFRGLL